MTHYLSPKHLLRLLLLAMCLAGTQNINAAEHCTDAYSIDQTLSNGARWDMCWTHDDNHGIRYHHIYYTPKSGTRRMVLMDAAVSQIHVPYDDNGARYHDVSDYGLGAGYLRSMTNAECPDGRLRQYGSKNAVCTQVKKHSSAFRVTNTSDSQESLKVFSLSKVGAYVYIPQWEFFDDGRLVPSIMATGSLQRYTTTESHGWTLGAGRIGIAHIHNYFWRLDFDLNGTAKDDVVKEINYNVSAGQRRRSMTTFTSEAARSLSPTQHRSWLISDGNLTNSKGHAAGYEILLRDAGHREIGPSSEPFTANDFYVTRSKSCEQIASHNKRINTCTADSLDEFANNESLNRQDLVVWVGLSFYHMPRSEDYPKMDSHTNHFEIIPRDWHDRNPLKTLVTSATNDTASTMAGEPVTIDVMGNDSGMGISLNTVQNPPNGTTTISNGKIIYTPNSNFAGTESFAYSIVSPGGQVYSARVDVTVEQVIFNPPPVSSPDTATTLKNTAVTIDVLANDTGNGLVLQTPNPTSFNGGAVTLRNGKIRYTPKQDYVGSDQLVYTIKDTDGRTSSAQVSITIEEPQAPDNFAPVANGQSIQLNAGSTANIQLTASDADGDTLTYQVRRSPAHGRLTGSAPNLIYTPNAAYSGADNFTFVAADSSADSNVATVSIIVQADASDAVSNTITSPLSLDGSSADWSGIARFPNDPDDISGEVINWRNVAMAHDAQNVHLLYENYGNINPQSATGTYLPWGWQMFMDTDKNSETGFKIGDIGADFILEGTAIHRYVGLGSNWNWETVRVSDARYRNSTAEIRFNRATIGNPNAMYLLMRGNNAAVGGELTDFYPDGQNSAGSTERHFHYEFVNATGSGVIANPQLLRTTENSAISIVLSASDSLGRNLTYQLTSNPSHGTLTGVAPNLRYTPTQAYTGSDSFTFRASNGTDTSDNATVAIQINAMSSGTVSNNVASMQIDGNSSEWNNLAAFNADPDDMSLATDTINWQSATVAHSNSKLYVLYRNHGDIDRNGLTNDYIPWGWQTYLDTDNNADTGFRIGDIGADYLMEATLVNKYTGNGSDWSWNVQQTVDLFHRNDIAEISLPLSAIGSPTAMRLVFKGNNLSVGGSESDLYPDNADSAGATDNYFSYSLEDSLQTQSARPSASNQEVDVSGSQPSTITLNGTASRGTGLSYKLVTPPANGTLGPMDQAVSYTPRAGFSGDDSFEYVVNDGVYDSSVARVNVRVARSDTSSGSDSDSGSDEDSGGGSFILPLHGLIGLLLLVLYRRRFSNRH